MAVILFVTALVVAVYSPWFQNELRERLVEKLNSEPDTEFRLGELRLRFPLDLTVNDVLMVTRGDTMLQAGTIRGDVSLKGLIDGKVNVTSAVLTDARYQIGAMDSASCMVIRARRAELDPTTIGLAKMDIDVSKARLDGGSLNLFINPVDTFQVPEEPTDPTEMTIKVGRLDYTDLAFTMNLLPVIDTLSTTITDGYLTDIRVDLLRQTVDVGKFAGSGLDARYIMPDSATIKSIPVVEADTTTSAPWTVRVGTIDIDRSRALYTTAGYVPTPGLDFGYIEADSLSLKVTDFYNRAATVSLPLQLKGRERSGLDLDIAGRLGVDSVGLTFDKFTLSTPNLTRLAASGYMSTVTELTDPVTPLRLALRGNLAVADAVLAFPDMATIARGLRPGALADMNIAVAGTSGELNFERLDLGLDGYLSLGASGSVRNVFDPDRLGGSLRFDGTVGDVSPLMKMLMTDASFVVPRMTLDGDVTFGGGDYDGSLTAVTNGGRIALDGSFTGRGDRYDATVTARDFPVSAFLPTAGIGRVTADLDAVGNGFDFFSKTTTADVNVDLKSAEYDKHVYRGVTLKAGLADGHADVDLHSADAALPVDLVASGNIDGKEYVWNADLKTGTLDLTALGFAEAAPDGSPTTVAANMDLDAGFTADFKNIAGTLRLHSLDYDTGESAIDITDLRAVFNTTDSTTNLAVYNGDMMGSYSSPMGLDSIMGRVDRLTAAIGEDIRTFNINVDRLQKILMPFDFSLDAGPSNIINDILSESGMSFGRLTMDAGNDSTLFMKGRVLEFKTATMSLDTIDITIGQHDGHLDLLAAVNNRPGTFDEWAHVDVTGTVDRNTIAVNLHQRNIRNVTGFKLGAVAEVGADSVVTLKLSPLDPVINYHDWKVNADNFITYDLRTRHLDADLMMKDDISRIALYTEHAHSDHADDHSHAEDLILQVFDIQLQDWLALNPFAPAIKGNLSAGIRVNYDNKNLTGNGTVSLTDLFYGKERVGDFQADINLLTDTRGLINMKSELWVNGEKTITLNGALNDSTRTSPFNLDLTMIHFPLRTVNPFLTGTAKLSGMLNGSMDVSGDAASPVLNGRLDFEDATILVDMLGTTFKLNNDSIPVRDNLVKLNRFTIMGCNENPLVIDGTVNIADMSSPGVNLKAKATNMQIVNASRPARGADVYGKAFVSLDASVDGNMNYMAVDANLDLLPGTNVYYVMVGGASTFENRTSEGMVKFVNFNDSAAMASADSVAPPSSIIDINANLNIQTGTIINVDLSASGQDRVQLQGNGSLTYTSSIIGADRLSGRYNLTGGFIKYSPPLISNLDFNFDPNSYVAFSGDMMNPRLNIMATENMRANVSQAGQNSRLIYFDIILKVTGTLNEMNVSFDLATDDDITVANELASMTPTQRASEAMNLLLYNTYTGGSTKATSNLNGNPLYSFLTSQINSWAAQNIKAVDISFGVDQYDKTTDGSTSTATSYSYQVSKSLFDDRFKIIVGGNYSTDANANENLANNLINDVSFEYFLNNARTMYVKLFRHTGYESILEGEITQTGVGFVYKKKINRVADMFIPASYRRRKKESKSDQPSETKVDTTPADTVEPKNVTIPDETLPEYL